jgi:voltage-gated potassium channel
MARSGIEKDQLNHERAELARALDRWLEWPLIILALAWLALLVVELVQGLDPFLTRVGEVIWAIFIVDFVVRLVLAPDRTRYLRSQWLTIISLLLPAVRVLRIFRILRAVRGLRLVRIIGSMNRGMQSLGRTMRRRGLPYVAALTLVVLVTGAAGMYAFENDHQARAFTGYAEALWWTAMLLTTIGSEYWPKTPEGRALALVLSLYALGILGYVAATLSSFFIGREAEASEGSLPGQAELSDLRREIASLRAELARSQRVEPGSSGFGA